MLKRWILLTTIVIVGGGFLNANSALAQPAANAVKVDRLTRVMYSIGDLVVPIENHSVFAESKQRKATPAKSHDEMAATLIQLITRTVSRDSWNDVGGKGTIQYHPLGVALVVNQTEDAHEQITQLLAALRRLYDVQVSAQVRVVETSPATAERLLGAMKKHGQPIRDRAVAVDDKRLLSFLEMAQADAVTTIQQTPKITLFSGQKAGISGRIDNVGVRFDLSGVVSADRKSVRLWLDFEDAVSTTRSMRTAETFNVPADRSVVWHVGEVGGTHVFVLGSPRIVIAQEEERLFLGEIQPIPGR